MRIQLDATSVEVFGGRGECVLTDLIFPTTTPSLQLVREGGDVTLNHLDVRPLTPRP